MVGHGDTLPRSTSSGNGTRLRGRRPQRPSNSSPSSGSPSQDRGGYIVVRDGKDRKGRVLGIVLETLGKGHLKKAFDEAVKGHRSPKRWRHTGADRVT
jgi:hypothetical protein